MRAMFRTFFLGISTAISLNSPATAFTDFETLKVGTTEIGLYGFIKFETLWEDRLTGNFPEVFPQNVPLNIDRADHHSQTILDARSSRLGVKVTDKVCGIDMKAVIEGDFFTILGDALVFNGRAFRMRLAYARADAPNGFFFLVGQFWTLPSHQTDIPSPLYVNTQNAPVGVAYARQPQLRFGFKRHFCGYGDLKIEGSIEKHAFNDLGFITPTGDIPSQGGEEPWPLLAGKLSFLGEKFKCSVAGAVAQTRYIFNTAGDDRKRDVWAVCGIVSYNWNNLTLWGTANHNEGLSSMFMGYFNNVALSTDFRLLAFKSSGGCIGVRWDWCKDILISNVLFGIQRGDRIANTFFTGNTLQSLQDLRVNLFYNFWKSWQFGIEYQTVFVKSFNGNKGRVNDIHLGIWYNFGKP